MPISSNQYTSFLNPTITQVTKGCAPTPPCQGVTLVFAPINIFDNPENLTNIEGFMCGSAFAAANIDERDAFQRDSLA